VSVNVSVKGGSTMTATNHDGQLDEIYSTMLNECNCTFGVGFSRFYCCDHHGHGFWPSWYVNECISECICECVCECCV